MLHKNTLLSTLLAKSSESSPHSDCSHPGSQATGSFFFFAVSAAPWFDVYYPRCFRMQESWRLSPNRSCHHSHLVQHSLRSPPPRHRYPSILSIKSCIRLFSTSESGTFIQYSRDFLAHSMAALFSPNASAAIARHFHKRANCSENPSNPA